MNKILENGHLQVTIPFKLRTVSARRKIVIPGITADGTEPLALAIARAVRWQGYIDSGKFKNAVELAKAVGLDKSVVSNTLRLRLLSPKIVHKILCGDIPDGLSLKQLRHGVPELWKEQEEKWGVG